MAEPVFGDVFDELKRGEVYSAGGSTGLDPSYQISQQRQSISKILDESGFADAMIFEEGEKRKKHIAKIKKLTGVQTVEGEGEFLRPGVKERAEKFNKSTPKEKLMLRQVSEGTMSPDQYYNQKQLDEQDLVETLKMFAKDPPSAQFSESGKPTATTPGVIKRFTSGDENVSVKAVPKVTEQRTRVIGGKGTDKDVGTRDKPTASLAQANSIQDTRDKLLQANPETGEKTPMTTANQEQYQQYTNEIARYKVADFLEIAGMKTNTAQKKATETIDVGFIEAPGEDLFIGDKLNISDNRVLRMIAQASKKGKKASDVLAILQDAASKQFLSRRFLKQSWEE